VHNGGGASNNAINLEDRERNSGWREQKGVRRVGREKLGTQSDSAERSEVVHPIKNERVRGEVEKAKDQRRKGVRQLRD